MEHKSHKIRDKHVTYILKLFNMSYQKVITVLILTSLAVLQDLSTVSLS